jgi:predicted ATPase with chaperone activity
MGVSTHLCLPKKRWRAGGTALDLRRVVLEHQGDDLHAIFTLANTVVAGRVLQARDRQRRRLAGSGWQTNSEVPGTYLRRHLPLPDGLQAVDEAVDRGRLSARGVDKV